MDSSSSATPLWRQGPAEKPVLCNACGSRYRHWGTLDNYLPKHSIGKDLVVPHPIICTNNHHHPSTDLPDSNDGIIFHSFIYNIYFGPLN